MSEQQTVHVHIGLGKTGTSTIQRALAEQQQALREFGIHMPGGSHVDTRRAVYDLMGRRIGGGDSETVTGAWKPFARSVVASTAPTVVFSEEMLALARPRVVRRLVESLAPRRVIVIVTVRDLGRVLGSYWQQMVMMGRTETLTEFLQAVRDPESGPASAGVGFWMRQDLIRTLNAWESAVPREDIRIVTLPAPGQAPDLLNDRFAEVIGAPAGLLRSSRRVGNASVGVPEAEVVRRLNELLAHDLAENQRLSLMRIIREGLVGRESAPITVPASEFDWIAERSAAMVTELSDRGYPVIGSLDDLTPRPGPATALPGSGGESDDAEVADAAIAALAAVSLDRARLWDRNRQRAARRRRRRGGRGPSASPDKLASQGRALSFRMRTWALAKADNSRVFGWAARAYLKQTSRR
ncbi:hypothetical protein NOCA2390006 [metagenome]|uniref:Sulfotransferase family protein n=1 Tax=metagenome TaxID=256318 RepID=A0A2P2C507_9ZZZZ